MTMAAHALADRMVGVFGGTAKDWEEPYAHPLAVNAVTVVGHVRLSDTVSLRAEVSLDGDTTMHVAVWMSPVMWHERGAELLRMVIPVTPPWDENTTKAVRKQVWAAIKDRLDARLRDIEQLSALFCKKDP